MQSISPLRLFVMMLPLLLVAHQLLIVLVPAVVRLIVPATLRTMLALL
jgi:hypothetical protein